VELYGPCHSFGGSRWNEANKFKQYLYFGECTLLVCPLWIFPFSISFLFLSSFCSSSHMLTNLSYTVRRPIDLSAQVLGPFLCPALCRWISSRILSLWDRGLGTRDSPKGVPLNVCARSVADPFQCSFHSDFSRKNVSIKFQSLFNTVSFLIVSSRVILLFSFYLEEHSHFQACLR
jgi:hypothetical protein